MNGSQRGFLSKTLSQFGEMSNKYHGERSSVTHVEVQRQVNMMWCLLVKMALVPAEDALTVAMGNPSKVFMNNAKY